MILYLIAIHCLESELCDRPSPELVLPEVDIRISLGDGVFESLGLVEGPQVHSEGPRVHHVTLILHLVHGHCVSRSLGISGAALKVERVGSQVKVLRCNLCASDHPLSINFSQITSQRHIRWEPYLQSAVSINRQG